MLIINRLVFRYKHNSYSSLFNHFVVLAGQVSYSFRHKSIVGDNHFVTTDAVVTNSSSFPRSREIGHLPQPSNKRSNKYFLSFGAIKTGDFLLIINANRFSDCYVIAFVQQDCIEQTLCLPPIEKCMLEPLHHLLLLSLPLHSLCTESQCAHLIWVIPTEYLMSGTLWNFFHQPESA